MNEQAKNYIEEGVYLGCLDQFEEWSERYAVIKSPKLERIVFFFSPELSTMDYGKIVYSKNNPEDIGKDGFKDMFPSSPARELKPNAEVYFYLQSFNAFEPIKENDEKSKSIFYKTDEGKLLGGKIIYNPEELKNLEVVPYRNIEVKGQIVDELEGDFIIDAGLFIFIRKHEGLKIGDWVKTQLYQIYFISVK